MPKPPPRQPPKFDLDALLDEWQSRLRLQDWDIQISWDSHYHVEAFGRTKTSLSNRAAVVTLVPPEQIQHECACDDPEVTLVHELLHVKAADVLENMPHTERPQIDCPLWECFIEHVAQALVAAKRGQQRIR